MDALENHLLESGGIGTIFGFEHGTNRVEGCVSCHVVHGSPNRQMRHSSVVVLGPMFLVLNQPKAEMTSPDASSSLSGSFQLGVRIVDVGGRKDRYRQDIVLQDGLRLFHLDLDYDAKIAEVSIGYQW